MLDRDDLSFNKTDFILYSGVLHQCSLSTTVISLVSVEVFFCFNRPGGKIVIKFF